MTRPWMAGLLYCLITIVLTHPLVLHLGSAFPHDPFDPALNTWILWWNARAMPYSSAWWNAPVFYPFPGALSFSEHLLGLSMIASPIQWLGGSPLLAYNVVFLLTFPLCAVGGYLLALELTRRHDAAFIGGLLFGFAPYRMAHLEHIQVLAAFGMPFALLGLHRYLREPRLRWLVLFGAGWLVQALSNGYYMLFFSTLVAMWVMWFARPFPKAWAAIAGALCAAALPLVPLIWQYRAIHQQLGFVRGFGTIRLFGADVLGVLSTQPAPPLALWGWLQLYDRHEGHLFPGVTVVALAIAWTWLARNQSVRLGAVVVGDGRWRSIRIVLSVVLIGTAVAALAAWRYPSDLVLFGVPLLSLRNPLKPLTGTVALGLLLLLTSARVRRAYSSRSIIGFYAVAALVTWILSLGPAPTVMGHTVMYRGPYALLMDLPGFSSLRVPARFWMMSVLCLAVVGAIAFDRLGSRFVRARRALAALVVLGAVGDAWLRQFPLALVPEAWRTQGCLASLRAGGAVVELPLGDLEPDIGAMYRSMSHLRPVANGYSGYSPPHYGVLRAGLAQRDRELLTDLAAVGVTDILVNRGRDADRRWDDYVASHGASQLICDEGEQALYRVAPQPEPADMPVGRALRVASVHASVDGGGTSLMMDGDRQTRWHVRPQRAGTTVEVDLGIPQTVTGIELALGPFAADFPRSMLISSSADGITWTEVWRGGSAGPAFAAALEEPRDVPIRYRFPAVQARRLRLTLTADDEAYWWSIAELRVMGS